MAGLPAGPVESARRATPADHADLVRLAREARAAIGDARGGRLLSLADEPLDGFEATLPVATSADADHAAWVGTLDGQVVGYGMAESRALRGGERLAVLHELYVEPGARQVGVGEALLDEVLAWAAARGCRGIDARALPGDRSTKNFFETAGLVARAIVVHRDLADPRREDHR